MFSEVLTSKDAERMNRWKRLSSKEMYANDHLDANNQTDMECSGYIYFWSFIILQQQNKIFWL